MSEEAQSSLQKNYYLKNLKRHNNDKNCNKVTLLDHVAKWRRKGQVKLEQVFDKHKQ